MTSGAIHACVPPMMLWLRQECFISADKPTSEILAEPSAAMRTFRDLTSRCTTLQNQVHLRACKLLGHMWGRH